MHSCVALLRRWWQVSACGLSQWSPSGRGSHPACSHNEGGSRTNPWWHTLGGIQRSRRFSRTVWSKAAGICLMAANRQDCGKQRIWENEIHIQQVIEGHLLYLHPHPKKMHTFGSRQNISSPAMEDRKLQGIHMCTCAAMAMERLKHLWHCWTRVLPSNSKTVTQDTLSQHNPLQKVALQTQREFDHPSNSYIHLTYFVICVVPTVCLQKGLFWKGPHLVVYYVCCSHC